MGAGKIDVNWTIIDCIFKLFSEKLEENVMFL
jgi:hypothetical protein